MRVLAIIPAFNEERSLAGVVAAIRLASPEVDVCVVDDGSTDGTAALAVRLKVILLKNALNLGIGGAVQAGYLWARDHAYDAAVQVDGDGQHDPSFLPALLEPLKAGEAGLVIGSRFMGADPGDFRSTFVRRAGIRYLCWALAVRCGARLSDPTSGFRAASRAAIELFASSYPSDYPEPESVAIAARQGIRIAEVPVKMSRRLHGASSITPLRTLYYLVKVTLALALLPPPRAARAAEGAEAGP